MTGNVVLTALAATNGWRAPAIRHVLPLVAFLAGVLVGEVLRLPRVRALVRHPAAGCLGLEAMFLACAAGLRLPTVVLSLGISFVAALQNAVFRQMRGAAYSTIMVTGNLRALGTAVFYGLFMGDVRQRRAAARFGVVCAAFTVGAAVGGRATTGLGHAALWYVVALLVPARWMLVRRQRAVES
jgi:uncharacterized membrane protein YoaK (UPF0700 family)